MMASGAPSGAALAEAKAAHEAGDLRKADRLYRRILRKDPNNAAALNLHGILASQSGDPRRAVQSLKRAVAIDCDTVDYQINLGVVLESSGDIASAYDHYASTVERKPRNAGLLGRAPEAAGRPTGTRISRCCWRVSEQTTPISRKRSFCSAKFSIFSNGRRKPSNRSAVRPHWRQASRRRTPISPAS
tara:strand:- start:266 stop:829 length:564 start_codon:yes stop_codon:yes gene_type:complete